MVANQVFKSVNRSYFFDIVWQIIPDVASMWPKRELVSISSSKWYWYRSDVVAMVDDAMMVGRVISESGLNASLL